MHTKTSCRFIKKLRSWSMQRVRMVLRYVARKYFQKMALELRQKAHEKNGDVFPREADGMQSCPQLSKKRVPKRKKRFVVLRSNFANMYGCEGIMLFSQYI
eukprot:scaffold15599_cov129-Skeletonema_dohrnii-CCMP3373.AAC.9